MSGIKGRSGRKKTPSTLVNEALARVDQRLPELFEVLIGRAIAGDKDAAIYLIDRKLGKPCISVDQRVRGVIGITADERRTAIMEVITSQAYLLDEPNNDKDLDTVPSFTEVIDSTNQTNEPSHE
jgi:hypothetical protein